MFNEIIKKGWNYKHNSDDFVDQVTALLAEVCMLGCGGPAKIDS